MRIAYETRLPDIHEWRCYWTNRPGVQRHLWEERCGMAAVAAFAVFTILYVRLREIPLAAGMATGLFVVLALAAWHVERRRWRVILQWKATKCPSLTGLGRRTLEITDDTLTESSLQHSVCLQWALIERIVYRPRYLFFVLLDQSALIVPLETITPATDGARFLDFLRRCAPPELRGEIPETVAPATTSSAIPSKSHRNSEQVDLSSRP